MVFSAVNPGIPCGGGIVGESKSAILAGLSSSSEWTLPARLIEPGPPPRARAAFAIEAVAGEPGLGGFPVILKPDIGERGRGVRLARADPDIREYFEHVHGPVIVQRYHPGPHECGVLWARCPDSPDGRAGFVFSITRKAFPFVVGDGRRTLEQLIWAHPRHHAQSPVFLERWASRRDWIPTPGEHVRLAESGNHCQGTMFADGADLLTPELEARIDSIAASFRGLAGGELDIGRFDLRFESEAALRRGEGFRIVELNGTASESGNIYDPERGIWWAWTVLARHWSLLYRLGAWRRARGGTPMGLIEMVRTVRAHRRSPRGPDVSD
jgi:hypothetical protein